MYFYILSDLHFGENRDLADSQARLKKLCAEIRSNPYSDNIELFVILGDFINAGNAAAFDEAGRFLDTIRNELHDFDVRFAFMPGNHDLSQDNIHSFDVFAAQQGCRHRYESGSAYSDVYDGVNFIFAGSNLVRDHSQPDVLDLGAIRSEMKDGMQNLLLCHHSLTQDFGGDHHTVTDGQQVKARFEDMGIRFVFHGHTHRACVSQEGALCEIGCGAFAKDVSAMPDINNQLIVSYIRDREVSFVQCWIVTADGTRVFVPDALYPEVKKFADPDTIGKRQ